ncbi:unnamed protein product [Rotaria magnacalcarata]|nr:unnamed protein product [Rotaria magnacalcarata]CAF2053457.1 unnamed protein product [Rotaria magnacalcarata]
MANKQKLSSLKITPNLCEISTEYPALKEYLTPRHLCTSIKPEISQTIHTDKFSNRTINQDQDRHVKEPKTHSKNATEHTEVIKLFQYKQHEEINDKLYKKCRNYLIKTISTEEDEKDDNAY